MTRDELVALAVAEIRKGARQASYAVTRAVKEGSAEWDDIYLLATIVRDALKSAHDGLPDIRRPNCH